MAKNDMSRREETSAVKKALKKEGIKVLAVRHGKGTGWGWIEVDVEHLKGMSKHDARGGVHYHEEEEKYHKKVKKIVEKATGRSSGKEGKVLVSI